MEKTQKSFNKGIVTQAVVYPYHGKLICYKKDGLFINTTFPGNYAK